MHGGGGQPRAGVYRPGHAAGCNAALQRPARPGVTRFAGMWAECLLARARPDPSAKPPDRPGRPIGRAARSAGPPDRGLAAL